MLLRERKIPRDRIRRSALISLRKCVSSKKFAQKMNAIYDAVKAEVVEIAVECC